MNMLDEIQEANFLHLQNIVKTQIAVRRCEIEGSVWDLEGAIATASDLGLISFKHYSLLEEKLSAREAN
jgi:hypothetical protein